MPLPLLGLGRTATLLISSHIPTIAPPPCHHGYDWSSTFGSDTVFFVLLRSPSPKRWSWILLGLGPKTQLRTHLQPNCTLAIMVSFQVQSSIQDLHYSTLVSDKNCRISKLHLWEFPDIHQSWIPEISVIERNWPYIDHQLGKSKLVIAS